MKIFNSLYDRHSQGADVDGGEGGEAKFPISRYDRLAPSASTRNSRALPGRAGAIETYGGPIRTARRTPKAELLRGPEPIPGYDALGAEDESPAALKGPT